MLRKGDILLLILIVFTIMITKVIDKENEAISLKSWNNYLVFSSNKGELVATIKKDNSIIRTINLSKLYNKEIIKVSGQYSNTIVAEHNRIRFLDSDCPENLCVKAGWLCKAGDLAICLPNKTVIKVALEKATN